MTTHTLIEEEERVEAAPPIVVEPIGAPVRVAIPLNRFSDCLLEATGRQRILRRRSVLFSAALQFLVIGLLVLIPLIYTDVLPAGQLLTYLMTAPPPAPPPPAPAVVNPANITSNILNGQLVSPTAVPAKIQMIHEDEAPPAPGGVPGGVVGGVPGGQLGGVMSGVLGGIIGSNRPPAVQELVAPKRMRISQGVSEGMLLAKFKPEYPTIARIARIEGVVVLEAVISKDGLIENLRVVSGHPALIPSAMDAVKQWRYRPYLLNGIPVDVETKITVTFSMSGP
jgi:periplasmic protein TonB